jgi:hypothetical protein
LASRLLSENVKIKTRVYKNKSLPLSLYGCETWSLTLREEHTLKVGLYENRLLRRIFGPKRDEIVGGWKKLHNGGLRNLYFSSNIMRMVKSMTMKWAGYVASMRKGRMHRGFDGKARRKETASRT